MDDESTIRRGNESTRSKTSYPDLLFLRAALIVLCATWVSTAQPVVKLTANVESPAPLGTIVIWTAEGQTDSGGPLQYRFRARQGDGPFSVIRDFGPNPELIWSAFDREGFREIELTVKDSGTGESASIVAGFEFTPLTGGETPVVTATWHPLVFMYSAPPCAAGASMTVRWQLLGGGGSAAAPAMACDGRTSMNFLIAGLRSTATYSVWQEVTEGDRFEQGEPLLFTTPEVESPVAPVQVSPAGAGKPGVLLQSSLGQMTAAHDLDGNLVWYYAGGISSLTRAASGGRFLGIVQDPSLGTEHQAVRMFDLVGITLKETNAARINEQLRAMGVHEITGFHHEALEMPDGQLLVLASSERILRDIQGEGDIDVIGDTILVLNQELEVTWAWDSFEHLDPRQTAVLGETCTPTGGGCPPFYLAPKANDWLHSNSLQLGPDGNILVSMRHQDQILKVDYQKGVAWGEVLWRFGRNGDFAPASDDPWPWPSHQHDASILNDGTLLVYDNGNTRWASDRQAHSRGQRWQLDENTMTATLLLNADLGVYSPALGSAQRLEDGGFHFNSGLVFGPAGQMAAVSVETGEDGQIQWRFSTPTPEYRTFRMRDLYTPVQ